MLFPINKTIQQILESYQDGRVDQNSDLTGAFYVRRDSIPYMEDQLNAAGYAVDALDLYNASCESHYDFAAGRLIYTSQTGYNLEQLIANRTSNQIKSDMLFDSETQIEFWHSDEQRPFVQIWGDRLIVGTDGAAMVYSRDYTDPIATINEWSFWQTVTEEKS